MKLLIFILLIQQLLFVIYVESQTLGVKHLTVVFRHGDRAPDPGRESYPNDPYKNYSFYPLTRGELNNAGKRREYTLGALLREEYDKFLGDTYYSRDVYARSTEYRRAKMSLQLVLSGLYPPKKSQIWHPKLNWQPISISYVPGDDDTLLIPEECPQYLEELKKVRASSHVTAKLATFRSLMKNLTIFTGKSINTSIDMYDLYNSLSSERSMNLTLPEWTKGIFPSGRLLDGILFEYEIVHFNDKLKRLNGGTILRHIIDSMSKMIKGGKTEPKVHLLSGHETNVASLLNTLNIFEHLKPHVPQYSSAVIVALLHEKVNNNYYVEVRYYRGIPSVFEKVEIPDCPELCPLETFKRLMKNVIPSDEEMACRKTGSLYRNFIGQN